MSQSVKILLVAALLLLPSACSEKKEPVEHARPEDAATAYYALLSQGKYAEFVSGMQSCDDKPDTYREQMTTLIKQHYTDAAKEGRSIHSVTVVRTQTLRDTVAANVFLNLTYNDSTTEEIVQPMVWDGNSWRMR